jgi:uncharacterized protein YdcH (DUF465 family)
MPISQQSLEEILVRDNPEYRELHHKHQSFEEKLEKLTSRSFLNDEEKLEATTLKKQKLALKDRMAEIAKKHAAHPDGAGH